MRVRISIYGIYRDGALLYVGASSNLENRLKRHYRRFGGYIVLAIFRRCRTVRSAALSERHFIRNLKPLANVRRGGGGELLISNEAHRNAGRKAWKTRIANLEKKNKPQ